MALGASERFSDMVPSSKRWSSPGPAPHAHGKPVLWRADLSRVSKSQSPLPRLALLGGMPRRRTRISARDNDELTSTIPSYDLENLDLATWTAPPHVTTQSEGHEGWSQSEVSLFNRLNDRGAVPVIPTSWKLDFPTFPDTLFSDTRLDLFMRPMGKNFHGIKAFHSLVSLGSRVRDRLDIGGNPATLLERAVQGYIKWALKDADLAHSSFLPTIFVATVKRGEEPQKAIARVEASMHVVADQYRCMWGLNNGVPPSQPPPATRGRKAVHFADSSPASRRSSGFWSIFSSPFKSSTPGSTPATTPRQTYSPWKSNPVPQGLPLPTLYAIVIARSVVEVCTFDPAVGPSWHIARRPSNRSDGSEASEAEETPTTADQLRSRSGASGGRPSRHIATFLWSDDAQDVWNAFAVAIVVLQAREWLLQYRKAVGGFPAKHEEMEDYDA